MRGTLAALLLALIAPSTALSANNQMALIAPRQTIAPKETPYSLSIQLVLPGQETLKLSARLAKDGPLIASPILWRLRDANGQIIVENNKASINQALKPGDYQIDAYYGSRNVRERITLLEGNQLNISFILDIGGIRILPRLDGVGVSNSFSKILIYATSGIEKGELIAPSTKVGELIRVPVGDYRIESHIGPGNEIETAYIKVTAGILSAVEINHRAGWVRLYLASTDGAPDDTIIWNIEDPKKQKLEPIIGSEANYILKPGTYQATAHRAGKTLTKSFSIKDGDKIEIALD